MGPHCDCTFPVYNSKFIPSANSQVQNTATLIYSLGGKRELNWSRRSRGKRSWTVDSWEKTYQLLRDTVCIIHPDDEDPKLPISTDDSFQY